MGEGDLAKERGLIPLMSKVGGWGILRNGGLIVRGGGVNTPLRTMGKYNINKLGTGLLQKKKQGGWMKTSYNSPSGIFRFGNSQQNQASCLKTQNCVTPPAPQKL